MKLNVTNFLSATILTAQSMAGLRAQEPQPAEDMATFPMQFSIVYPMTTQGSQTVDYRYHLSFNLISGKVGAVNGVEFGGFFNQAERDVKGVQFGGLANRTREVTGVQFGGLANMSHNVTGVQYSGLGNISKAVKGIQFGGITNVTDSIVGIQFGGIANICKEATGIQFGGIANMSEHTKGLQFGGVANVTEKSEGLQFAGITNVTNEVSGASFAGAFNRTGTLRGFQFGFVNVVDTVESGISMAIVNIVKKGFYNEWSLAFADYLNVGLSYKMGTQKFYTILTAGANFLEDRLWAFGFGFGNRTPLGRRVDFQPEIVTCQYYPQDFKNIQSTSSTHLKFGFVFKLNDRLGIAVAPGIYHFNTDITETKRKISPIPPFFEFETNHSDRGTKFKYLQSFGAGISVGLVLK